MTQLRALVAEDEPILSLTLLRHLEKLWPDLQICSVVDNGVFAVQEALAQLPDILFLDIKMPGKTGLEAAQELAEEWPDSKPFPLIVYVTAYDEFAVDAFEHAASDYVLKPVSEERLSKTVTRLQARLDNGQERSGELERVVAQLRNLIPGVGSVGNLGHPGSAGNSNLSTASNNATEKLTLIRAAVGNQIRMIPIGDVLYFEATDKYINVVTAEHSSLIRVSLRELLPQLDSNQFWQIHRSTVVNTQYIHTATRDGAGKLTLKLRGNNDKLQVSRVYAHLFKQM
ncbi:LytTR family DNA-binding domain-containing protein [Undibacterium sp. Jales W-56]|uniref:LytR/AlgR family response regulator transcription factor n=1 Tax=Undibacterium sp. Jales W-56 TaxID=2897325 RepID=UPI0021CEDF69|nr:LytTR family DNA-binding domain-containing protein [Undibacterium sp. Jales W-56]MCU6435604.1 LytTR family DNA-binding domain-containing protein [Undibacterium sp. Jales W-56]